MIATPAGISATLAGVMLTGANYLGTASQVFQGATPWERSTPRPASMT